ncbi:(2,3-dihydroxybenzoyl)adenylate synthase [Corallincola luteus]|uniref:(2,3-dihydroxybenzoyl)adenylate synthase n=1 Tax=Corallincola luteus TaxID=1775177 RepID=A0ABY2ALA8_9GAMM|nr:(2,3-dihydroxybenzoyl)adenylate synthase [Corallincola luteus]TCI03698.1 (2,3-dihydroxybenzoyl)adenylate synthase [Corallincola luteus]
MSHYNVIQTDPNYIPWPESFAQQYRDEGYWTDTKIQQLVELRASSTPTKTALVCGERRWSYVELAQQVERLAVGFQSHGLQCGDKVVLHLPNIAEFYLCFFALLKLGVQPVLALPAHRTSEIRYFCNFVKAKAYIVAEQGGFNWRELAEGLLHDRQSVQKVFCLQRGDDKEPSSLIVDLQKVFSDGQLRPSKAEPAFAFFQLSGGTTGAPKLIPRTHSDYLYSVRRSTELCELTSDDSYLCVLPCAHNFPLSSPGALGFFMVGGTVILAADATPQTAFQLIEQHGVTVSALVPPLALLWLDLAKHSRFNISPLRLLQVGGAKFSAEAAKRVRPVLGCQLQQVFGMAEGLVNYTRLNDDEQTVVYTQGRPMSDADEIRVLGSADKPVEVGEVGHLQVRGPYTIRGYYAAPEHNHQAFTQDGFYRTGDLVRLTPSGNIEVVGRSKDQINRGGEKIAAEEVENHLIAHLHVHDAAVISLPDPYLGERSCAVLVSQTERPKAIEIKRFLRARGLAEFKIPDRIEWVDTLPKTAVGKVNKKQLQMAL